MRKSTHFLQDQTIVDLTKHLSVYNDYKLEWASTRYVSGTIRSIMKRVPMHEPWIQHENLAPAEQNQTSTDREVGGE